MIIQTIAMIALGISILMILVILHEIGHFATAKYWGVKVLEFGVGIPPKIWKMWTDRSGTEYTMNAIPLGGFVRLKGEDPDASDFFDPDSFIMARFRPKIVILLGGIAMNILTARVLFALCFAIGIKPIHIVPSNIVYIENHSLITPSLSYLHSQGYTSGSIGVYVADVASGSIAADIDIRNGDMISYISGVSVDSLSFSTILQTYIGKSVMLDISRSGQIINKTISCPEDNCVLGVMIENSLQPKIIKMNIGQAIYMGGLEVWEQSKLSRYMLSRLGAGLFSGNGDRASQSISSMSGPVGMIYMTAAILKQGGWISILARSALISMSLAIFNLLPIPALDGGRILGVIIQTIFRLPVDRYFKIEGYINTFFFILLMSLGIYIMFQDFLRFG